VHTAQARSRNLFRVSPVALSQVRLLNKRFQVGASKRTNVFWRLLGLKGLLNPKKFSKKRTFNL
jgi:hypothetical protein